MIVLALGTSWAWTRGGHDFKVFYHAFEEVYAGRALTVYTSVGSPDRYLYAPGFALLLAWMGALPFGLGFGLWQALQWFSAFLIAQSLYRLAREGGLDRPNAERAVAIGFAFGLRALLIDLQYGQVNLIILAVCLRALHELSLARARPTLAIGGSWAALAFCAVAKIYPAPLLLLPWISRGAGVRAALLGSAVGLVVILGAPFVFLGPADGVELYSRWFAALAAKGLPLESHNQSWIAGCVRWLTLEPVHVMGWGYHLTPLGLGWLNAAEARRLGAALSVISVGLLLHRLLRFRFDDEWVLDRSGQLFLLLLLPGYLVWKPYFVLCIPAGAAWAAHVLKQGKSGKLRAAVGSLAFVLINLTSIDVIGAWAGGRFEAASAMLLGAVCLGVSIGARRRA